MMKKILYLIFCVSILNCSGSGNDPSPAELEFIYLPSLDDASQKAINETTSLTGMVESNDFELNEIRGTKSYHFIVKNNSDFDAEDVELTISTELEGITVDKVFFDKIPSFESLDLDEILTNYIVKVTVTHGLSPNGDGSIAPLQPRGNQSIVLRASNLGANIEAVASFEVLIAELSVFDENGEIDMSDPDSGVLVGGFEANAFFPQYNAGTDAKIVNTGNVDLPVQIFNNFLVLPVINVILEPGEEYEVWGDRTVTVAILEATAVRDFDTFPVINNQKFYFALDRSGIFGL